VQLGEEAHLNTNFKHLYLFIQEFKLVDPAEMQPLDALIQRLFPK
jgi:MOB kinase activator 1